MTGEKSGLPTLFQKSRKHTALTGELMSGGEQATARRTSSSLVRPSPNNNYLVSQLS